MPRFCEYRTLYSLAKSQAGVTGSPQDFYRDYQAYHVERLRAGEVEAQGDIRACRNELLFYSTRKPSYRVYPAMASALATTKIDIPSEEILLPFEVFEIQLQPETFWVDEESAHAFDSPALLKGRPYLCGLLVSKAPLLAPELKVPPGTQALQIFWDIRDSGNPDNFFDARSYVVLIPNKKASEGIDLFRIISQFQAAKSDQERVASLVVGTIFLAISKDRKWVSKTRIRIKNKDWCLCGSGKRYKHCCAKKTTKAGDPLGFLVGKDIDLPYTSSSNTGVIVEGRGSELQYSHIRSGHMRWQWKNDKEGNRFRELIFIAPSIIRSDLPLKPELTPRRIRPKKPPKQYNPSPWRGGSSRRLRSRQCEDCRRYTDEPILCQDHGMDYVLCEDCRSVCNICDIFVCKEHLRKCCDMVYCTECGDQDLTVCSNCLRDVCENHLTHCDSCDGDFCQRCADHGCRRNPVKRKKFKKIKKKSTKKLHLWAPGQYDRPDHVMMTACNQPEKWVEVVEREREEFSKRWGLSRRYYRNPDIDIRSLEREWHSKRDPEIWEQLQAARQRESLPYDRTRILSTQSHEKILRKLQKHRRWSPGVRHGEHLLFTKLSNDWFIETWYDENEWDEHGSYPGEPIAWTTLVYQNENRYDQVGPAVHCRTIDCALSCHQEKVQGAIDGSIEGAPEGYRRNPAPYEEASHGICVDCRTKYSRAPTVEQIQGRDSELRKIGVTSYCSWCKQIVYDPDTDIIYRYNPKCFICYSDPCCCDPKYRQWLDRVDTLLFAAVGMKRRELPSDYMWADAYESGLTPIATINMMVGPLDDPERLKEAIYIEGAGFGPYQRAHKLSNEEIGKIALGMLKEEVKRTDHFYHGSPYSGLISTTEFEGRYLFLTPSPGIARDYTIKLPASGKRPKKRRVINQKTIYTLKVNLSKDVIFDTRRPEHQRLYREIRSQLKLEIESEDWPSKDLMLTPDLPDSSLSTAGFYPDFGSGLNIIPSLQERGFRALWVSEGSQGASLGLFYPEDAVIIDTQYLD